MGELSLDLNSSSCCSPPPPPLQSIQQFLKEASRIGNVPEKLSKVDGYVKSLEEEMKKIDAFKRELPLCMLLLNDAIRALKLERMQWKAAADVVVVAKDGNGSAGASGSGLKASLKGDDLLRDKKNWMSSVQLWNNNAYSADNKDKHKAIAVALPVEEGNKKDGRSASTNGSLFAKNGEGGGASASAYPQFKGLPAFLAKKEEKDRKVQEEPALSLVTPGIRRPRAEPSSILMNSKLFGGGLGIQSPSTEIANSSLQAPAQSQGSRKQRRCWSPDLHRRFLNALQQLGGSQVATPKQIRELMKVDGLTNDEVKSHLQKYRLHTRRYSARANANANGNVNGNANASGSGNASAITNGNDNAAAPDSQRLVLFGGLWVPREQCGTSKTSTSESESPQGPLQLMGTSGGTSTTGGDSMEDEEEDEKSESYTWKGQFYKPGEDDA